MDEELQNFVDDLEVNQEDLQDNKDYLTQEEIDDLLSIKSDMKQTLVNGNLPEANLNNPYKIFSMAQVLAETKICNERNDSEFKDEFDNLLPGYEMLLGVDCSEEGIDSTVFTRAIYDLNTQDIYIVEIIHDEIMNDVRIAKKIKLLSSIHEIKHRNISYDGTNNQVHLYLRDNYNIHEAKRIQGSSASQNLPYTDSMEILNLRTCMHLSVAGMFSHNKIHFILPKRPYRLEKDLDILSLDPSSEDKIKKMYPKSKQRKLNQGVSTDYSDSFILCCATPFLNQDIIEEDQKELKIEVNYDEILTWIREECRDMFRELQLEALKIHREKLKKNWGKMSIENFRAERKEIDKLAELYK